MTALAQPEGRVTLGLPFDEYTKLPGEHSTSLHDLLVSPRMYWWRKRNKRPDKDSFRVGRAGHTAILEPDRFLLEYTVFKGARRAGALWKEFKAANADKTILTVPQYELALRMRDAARKHPIARRYLDKEGRTEVTLQWTHVRTGLPCKARLDWWCDVIADVKSTRNPAPAKFSGDAARFAYPMQLAFYADGLVACTGERPPVKIFAVQNVEPYDVVVYDVPEDTQDIGRQQVEHALGQVAACSKSNEWPGLAYAEEVPLKLPLWATPEAEEELTMGGESLF